MKIIIRPEKPADYLVIDQVNEKAFGQINEGELVRKLRQTQEFIPELSLIAETNMIAVGHILFYPVSIESEKDSYQALSLAPMSVLPLYQKKSIGSQLVREGLKRGKELGYLLAIVLGHSKYYPRFGFEPASRRGIYPPFKVPDDVFFAIELIPGALKNVSGTVVYPEAFSQV